MALPLSYNLHILKFEDINESTMSFGTTQVQKQHVDYKNWPTPAKRNRAMGERESGAKNKSFCLSCNGRLLSSKSKSSGLEGRQKATPRHGII